MADDFFNTADLMYLDSRYLHQDQRWHNACYLAGYVVECTLKAIAVKRGFSPAKLGKSYGHKLPRLVALYTSAQLVLSPKGIPFDFNRLTTSHLYVTWDPAGRYDPTLWNDQPSSDDYQRTAGYVYNFLIELYLNGEV